MKKKVLFFLCVMFLVFLLPVNAKADMGPKPSTTITFTGLEGQKYYAALLSEEESVGPHHAYDGTNPYYNEDHLDAYDNGEELYEIWKKFLTYEDADGFYFLQDFEEGNGDETLQWGYYPPEVFKLLLYFPEDDTFVVSDRYEKHDFDAYYTVQVENREIQSVSEDTRHGQLWKLGMLAVRMTLTVLIELGIAVLFEFRRKKQLLVLGITNIVTQLMLNAMLAALFDCDFGWVFIYLLPGMLVYLPLETLVFTVEAIVYVFLLPKYSEKSISKKRIVGYTLTANVISFAAGIFLAAAELSLYYSRG